MKKILIILIVISMLTIFIGSTSQAQNSSFKVIVNRSNEVSSMTKDQVSRFFLRKDIHWANGREVDPVDLTSRSAVRKVFSEEIHGKRVSVIKAYWQKMIFSGRAVPPPEKAGDNEVIAYVQANPDAIGYVSASAQTGAVKVLRIIE